MSNRDAIRAECHTIMFDLYGTLLDMHGGLTRALNAYFEGKGRRANAAALVSAWRRLQFEHSMIDALLHREHTAYREIARRTLAATLAHEGVEAAADELRELVAEIEKLEPYSEVPGALRLLAARFQLTALSNADPDMLGGARKALGVDFARMISAAEAGSFKPHVATYRLATELVGCPPDAILFVAAHAFDCVGAKAYGMRTCYLDRHGERFGEGPYQPDVIVKDLRALVDLLV
jgi:2-haloacid dehalogenase